MRPLIETKGVRKEFSTADGASVVTIENANI